MDLLLTVLNSSHSRRAWIAFSGLYCALCSWKICMLNLNTSPSITNCSFQTWCGMQPKQCMIYSSPFQGKWIMNGPKPRSVYSNEIGPMSLSQPLSQCTYPFKFMVPLFQDIQQLQLSEIHWDRFAMLSSININPGYLTTKSVILLLGMTSISSSHEAPKISCMLPSYSIPIATIHLDSARWDRLLRRFVWHAGMMLIFVRSGVLAMGRTNPSTSLVIVRKLSALGCSTADQSFLSSTTQICIFPRF